MLEVRLIGTFDIKCDGKPIKISSRLAQSLFAYLILTAGVSHRREKLAGMFWPDVPEEKARAYLRHELWRIRKSLSAKSNVEFLIAEDINISFNLSADYWLDANMLAKVKENSSVEELMYALSAYQGELLPGFYDEWISIEREHLRAVFGQNIASLVQLLEGEKRWIELVEWSEYWISFGDGPEEAYRALMVAYEALGDRAKVGTTYERCLQALDLLGLQPSEQTRALAFKRNSSLNIPIPLTSFIGREKDLKEIAHRLWQSRLVTLTGSGGVGKTRLSIQVVADVLELYPDGIWFLDLAPLNDPTLVSNALANVLGLQESGETKLSITDLLINYFRTRTALIIFDNCEHLIESCAQIVGLLLTSCEKLSVLATSREALRVAGEVPYRVPSLEIPMGEIELTVDEITILESVWLFRERARVVFPTFTVDTQNANAVAQICQKLDGIPLAIELAAARVNMLTVEQILKRLDDRFNLLTGGVRTALPRQQTLRATIEWSYGLLSEKERILFSRLAVFIGGWALEAAEEVCAGAGIEVAEVLDLLSQLVNKSLVITQQSAGQPRYRRLESIRQYACEKLLESGEQEHLRDKHLKCFVQLSEQAESALRGPMQVEWMLRLNEERDNIRSALEWAEKMDVEAGLYLAGRLHAFWESFDVREGARWLATFIENPESKAYPLARAKALLAQGWLLQWVGQLDVGHSAAQECLELYRMCGDQVGEADALALLAWIFNDVLLEKNELGISAWNWDTAKGMDFIIQALSLAQKLDDRGRQARILGIMGWASNDKVGRTSHLRDAVILLREVRDLRWLGKYLHDLAEQELLSGNLESAQEFLREAVSVNQTLNSKSLLGENSALEGYIELAKGNYKQARAKLCEGLSILESLGNWHFVLWRRVLLGQVAVHEGTLTEACEIFVETTHNFQEIHNLIGVLFTLEGMAGFYAAIGQPEKAARLIGWADQTREKIPDDRPVLEQRDVDQVIRTCITVMGDVAFAREYETGKRMTFDEAVVYASEKR